MINVNDKLLITSIQYLVKRDGFVIIPDWGTLFLQPTPARWDAEQNIFYAPSYQLQFNPRIKNNDGALAIELSKNTQQHYFDTLKTIANTVVLWNTRLFQFGSLSLDGIGTFNLSKGTIHFQSQLKWQEFPDFFGLQNIVLPASTFERNVVFSYPSLPNAGQLNRIVKTIIITPLVIALAILPAKINNYRILHQQESSFSQNIQLHSFTNNPVNLDHTIDTLTNVKVALKPSIQSPSHHIDESKKNNEHLQKTSVADLNNKNINHSQNKYYVILGSFTTDKQVNDFVNTLKTIDIEPLVLNCDGKRRVALNQYENQADAQKALDEFKSQNPTYSGWILKW
ncbi:MAG: SPOR domain-containing protein [Bacteroidales bacterium]|nr:SPOR domain-containing protein [Bacteroidales bacterium]